MAEELSQDTITYTFIKESCAVNHFLLNVPDCVDPDNITITDCFEEVQFDFGSCGNFTGIDNPIKIDINQSCGNFVTVKMPGASIASGPIGLKGGGGPTASCSNCISDIFVCETQGKRETEIQLCNSPCDDCDECTNDFCVEVDDGLGKRWTPQRMARNNNNGADPECNCTFQLINPPPLGCPLIDPLLPILECNHDFGNGTCQAFWGYNNMGNSTVQVPISNTTTGDLQNRFSPPPADRGQPETFLSGVHPNVFSNSRDCGGTPFLTWHLAKDTATATGLSNCPVRCDGVPLSNITLDFCGVCGGTNDGSMPCCPPSERDCNENGVADVCELEFDPDTVEECLEITGISNCTVGNLTLNETCLVIVNTTVEDCNRNDVIDSCEIASNSTLNCTDPDCQEGGILEGSEFCLRCRSFDENNNGIPDQCERPINLDCNDNGVSDFCEILAARIEELCNVTILSDFCVLGNLTNEEVCDILDLKIERDCNFNFVLDSCELNSTSLLNCTDPICDIGIVNRPDACFECRSFDINNNNIPDQCEDCNNNGIFDPIDIANGTSLDCNNNTIPDECVPPERDCNNNTIPDDCDISSGFSRDCNNDTIPDECEIADNPLKDCNNNTILDECDIASGNSTDCNNNEVPDECDLRNPFLFPDCNNNSIIDSCDIASNTSIDCDNNGIPDECDLLSTPGTHPDCNNNSIPDQCDIESGFSLDCNNNTVPDECDVRDGPSRDCNNNSIPDECDIASGNSTDCNNNTIPDECDIDTGFSLDCNNNTLPDECDLRDGTSQDCNNNTIPDECDINTGFSLDCNNNTVPDDCDILNGTSADRNNDTIPDECQVIGGCCIEDGEACLDLFTPEMCNQTLGFFLGANTNCSVDECPTTGACCFEGECCQCEIEVCNSVTNSTFFGIGTLCENITCPGTNESIPTPPAPNPGACCVDVTCFLCGQNVCEAAGGFFFGENTTCSQVICPGTTTGTTGLLTTGTTGLLTTGSMTTGTGTTGTTGVGTTGTTGAGTTGTTGVGTTGTTGCIRVLECGAPLECNSLCEDCNSNTCDFCELDGNRCQCTFLQDNNPRCPKATTGTTGRGTTGVATTGRGTTGVVTTGRGTTGVVTTGPVTTGRVTTGVATTGPVTTGVATTGRVTTGVATTGPVTTGPATTGPATTGPATTGPATTGPATTGIATTGPVTTGPATTGPTTTGQPSPENGGGDDDIFIGVLVGVVILGACTYCILFFALTGGDECEEDETPEDCEERKRQQIWTPFGSFGGGGGSGVSSRVSSQKKKKSRKLVISEWDNITGSLLRTEARRTKKD